MSAIDTAREIAKIAITSGLSTEIIGLLEKKIALLTEQITTLETENTNLKKKITNLEQELGRARPKVELADDTVKVLRLFFEHGELTVSQIVGALGMAHGMAEYHCGVLHEAEMIAFPMIITMATENPYYLLQKGRDYVVKNGLV